MSIVSRHAFFGDAVTPTAIEAKVLTGAEIATAKVTGPDWTVEGLFSHGHQHAIVGASESAKTWALFSLGLAIGHPDIPTFLGQPVRRHGRVAIESWEQGQAEDLRRLHKLACGHALALDDAFDNLMLFSETTTTLSDPVYFSRRLHELKEWGAVAYLFDSLSEGAGIELNDNTAYTNWWQGRIRPFLDAGIMVVFTHLTGHAKPGVGRTRDSAVRNATQIRALSTQVLECRQVADTRYRLIHNKHRNSTGLRFGFLELEGASDDPHVCLTMTAAETPADAANKQALARLRLIDLAQTHPVLDRKLIEKTLNDRTKPDAERVSDKVWESVIAEMTSEKLFKTAKRGNADTWTWIGGSPTTERDDDATLF